MANEWMKPDEICELLEISRRTLRRRAKQGKIEKRGTTKNAEYRVPPDQNGRDSDNPGQNPGQTSADSGHSVRESVRNSKKPGQNTGQNGRENGRDRANTGQDPGQNVDRNPNIAARESELDDDLAEVHDLIRFKWGQMTYQFGLDCFFEYIEDGEQRVEQFARNVWPRESYEHVDRQEYGVRYECVTHSDPIKHKTMAASAFVDKFHGKQAVAEAADDGVQVVTDSAHHLAYALGRWLEHQDDAPVIKITSTPGWHRNQQVYANGESIFGEDDWYADEDSIAMERRSQRHGALDDWIEAVDEEVTTNGLRMALGVSLAGPLVELLRLHPFFVHIYGNSSHGKSSAGRVAASVWSSPQESDNGLFQSWDASTGGFELLAASADGACLVLDEIAGFTGNDYQFARVLHSMTSEGGRVTMTRTRSERESRTWSITGVSTGEISMKAKVGDLLQGGQMVRMLDLDIEQGDVTEDGPHADRLRRRFSRAYGIVGDRWTEYLVNLDQAAIHADEWVATWRNRLSDFEDGTAEGERMLSHVHLVGAAVGMAREAGLVPWPEEEDVEFLEWMASRVMQAREGNKTPNERALELWYTMIDTQPAAFPFEKEIGTPKEVFGYSVKELGRHEIWTSERMVKKSGLPGKAGVSPRKWLQWCIEQDHCREENNKVRAGRQRRWKVFSLN